MNKFTITVTATNNGYGLSARIEEDTNDSCPPSTFILHNPQENSISLISPLSTALIVARDSILDDITRLKQYVQMQHWNGAQDVFDDLYAAACSNDGFNEICTHGYVAGVLEEAV